MGRIDSLLDSYRRHLAVPVQRGLPLSQRVWFAVYPPEEERRLLGRVEEFELATRDAGLSWKRLDLWGAFSDWMDTFEPEERTAILGQPEVLESYADRGFRDFVCDRIQSAIAAPPTTDPAKTVVAVVGLMDLYDFVHVSAVVDALGSSFAGVLLVFFPGDREGNTYRFLGARSGWDYLAVPILSES